MRSFYLIGASVAFLAMNVNSSGSVSEILGTNKMPYEKVCIPNQLDYADAYSTKYDNQINKMDVYFPVDGKCKNGNSFWKIRKFFELAKSSINNLVHNMLGYDTEFGSENIISPAEVHLEGCISRIDDENVNSYNETMNVLQECGFEAIGNRLNANSVTIPNFFAHHLYNINHYNSLSSDYNLQSDFISKIYQIIPEIESVRMHYENVQNALKDISNKKVSKDSITLNIHEMVFAISRMFKLELEYGN
ncbi:hypothetical protein AYI70_g2355 [Smittium culicis]|uniref:Uncharacterized protein n=1 Tax=Smittium culicis TaxID=133412 RepID=A0A1R1Y8Z1_9FUNG|nr:hypothetical protein AYI70_g2355 [Smittium culicis]